MFVLIVMALNGSIAMHTFPSDQICKAVRAEMVKSHQYKAVCIPEVGP